MRPFSLWQKSRGPCSCLLAASFVAPPQRIWLQYASSSRLACGQNPLRLAARDFCHRLLWGSDTDYWQIKKMNPHPSPPPGYRERGKRGVRQESALDPVLSAKNMSWTPPMARLHFFKHRNGIKAHKRRSRRKIPNHTITPASTGRMKTSPARTCVAVAPPK